jgi:hypothetical protein
MILGISIFAKKLTKNSIFAPNIANVLQKHFFKKNADFRKNCRLCSHNNDPLFVYFCRCLPGSEVDLRSEFGQPGHEFGKLLNLSRSLGLKQ